MIELGKQTINGFLDDLSSKQPTPGGGAVAGVLSAIGSSLGQMVLAYSEGKKSLSEFSSLHADCIHFFKLAQEEALVLAKADAEAYEQVSALWKLDKDNPIRIAQWDCVLLSAIEVPFRTMELSKRVLQTLQSLTGKTNRMLDSDLAISAIIAEAGARSAFLNVGVNSNQLQDSSKTNSLNETATALLDECRQLAMSIETACTV